MLDCTKVHYVALYCTIQCYARLEYTLACCPVLFRTVYSAALCYALICYALFYCTLCAVMLCCDMLCHTNGVQYFTTLCYTAARYVIPWHQISSSSLPSCTMPCYTLLLCRAIVYCNSLCHHVRFCLLAGCLSCWLAGWPAGLTAVLCHGLAWLISPQHNANNAKQNSE